MSCPSADVIDEGVVLFSVDVVTELREFDVDEVIEIDFSFWVDHVFPF